MAVSSVAKMRHNANVAVFGAGPVGLLSVLLVLPLIKITAALLRQHGSSILTAWTRTMAVAKALGARRILAIDVNQQRLDFAKTYITPDVHAAIPKNPGEDGMAYAKRHVSAA